MKFIEIGGMRFFDRFGFGPLKTTTIEMVLVKGEYRAIGSISEEELRELDQAHETGDIRAQVTLDIIRTGKRCL